MTNNSKIDLDTLKKLGKLSRIPIDETGSNELMEDLNKIIGFIEQLNEVDTDSVNPLSSVTGHNLPIREDIVDDGNKNNDVLENAPEKKSGYFVVPKVIEQMSNLLQFSISEVLSLLEKKEFSTKELVETYINAIEKNNKVSIIDSAGKVQILKKNKKSFIANKIAEIILDKLLIDDRSFN